MIYIYPWDKYTWPVFQLQSIKRMEYHITTARRWKGKQNFSRSEGGLSMSEQRWRVTRLQRPTFPYLHSTSHHIQEYDMAHYYIYTVIVYYIMGEGVLFVLASHGGGWGGHLLGLRVARGVQPFCPESKSSHPGLTINNERSLLKGHFVNADYIYIVTIKI